jgi:drug/metabolite transporter (DMT)-like permease
VLLTLPAMRVLPAHWPSVAALASLVVLGVLCTAIAMLLMFYLVNHAGASRATLITYINPAVASLLGIGLLDEHLGAGGIAAFGMILAGSWLASRGAAQRLEPRLAAER